MADPLSIIAGVIAVATVTVQSAKQVLKVVNDMSNEADEVKALSRDISAFCSITSALSASLKHERIRHIVAKDMAIAVTIQGMGCSLCNCQTLLGQIAQTLRRHCETSCRKHLVRISLSNLKWSISVKSRIKTLRSQLQASKSTLCSALSTFTLYVCAFSVSKSPLIH